MLVLSVTLVDKKDIDKWNLAMRKLEVSDKKRFALM